MRFDIVNNPLFRASRKRLVEFTHLPTLVRRIRRSPDVAATTRYDHSLTHCYDVDWTVKTRRGIVLEVAAMNCLKANESSFEL